MLHRLPLICPIDNTLGCESSQSNQKFHFVVCCLLRHIMKGDASEECVPQSAVRQKNKGAPGMSLLSIRRKGSKLWPDRVAEALVGVLGAR